MTQRNKFGLFRRYHREGPPQHDPDENTTLQHLTDVAADDASEPPPVVYHPFPNRSAFRLGDWYWNGGAQKSQTSFNDLVSIVGDPTFSPKDIRETQWDKVNQTLADDEVWDDLDAGWTKTEVSIVVPFQPRRGSLSDPEAGPKQFIVGDFYHRNLVDVIKEKLSNPDHDDHFHYDPYELKWQLNGKSEPIRVYGELYTSQAFVDAHNALQNSPREKDCTLSRHVVALMFSSDSTNLTSFGDATLWPIYLFFGNESKYRRCQPNCNLGNHVAYLRKVRQFPARSCFR